MTAKNLISIFGISFLSALLTGCGENFQLSHETSDLGHEVVIESAGDEQIAVEELDPETSLEEEVTLTTTNSGCMHGSVGISGTRLVGWVVSSCNSNGTAVAPANLYLSGTSAVGTGPSRSNYSGCSVRNGNTSSPYFQCWPNRYVSVVVNGKRHYGKYGFNVDLLTYYSQLSASNVYAISWSAPNNDNYLSFSAISVKKYTPPPRTPSRTISPAVRSCVNRYCRGRNATLYPVRNAYGQSNGSIRARCTGYYWVDTRGSRFNSYCSTGWRTY